MIDIRLARERPDELRRALARKGAADLFDELVAADSAWRQLTATVDDLRSRTRPKGKPSAEELAVLQSVKEELRIAEATLEGVEAGRAELLSKVPNPPFDDVPDGTSDEDAVEVRRVGEQPVFPFELRDHVELGGVDLDRGARLSGSRFAYRRGAVALLELAMYRYALDHVVGLGFEVLLPPVLVREEAMYGTGFLPTEEANLYRLEREELYLTGTSEVALAGFHQGEVLEDEALPLRYAGYSTCFRREAGAAGRDTRASSGSTSSTRWRCSPTRGRRTRWQSTNGSSPSRNNSSEGSALPTASSARPPATLAPPPPRSTTSRPSSRARGDTGRSPPARTPRTIRPGG